MKSGNNLLESAEPGPERDEIQAKLADAEKRWQDIKQNAAKHLDRVNAAFPEAEKYNEFSSNLEPWLSKTEENLQALGPVVANEDSLDELTKAMRSLRDDISQHRPERDTVSVTSGSLIDLTEADGDIVKNEAKGAVERYDRLDASLASREKDVAEVCDLIGKYRGFVKPVSELLDKVEATLESQGAISVDVGRNKEDLDSVKVWFNGRDAGYPSLRQFLTTQATANLSITHLIITLELAFMLGISFYCFCLLKVCRLSS